MPSFLGRLTDALRDAVVALCREVGNERLYVVALYTSGQSEFDYVCASANTEEGLSRIVAKAGARGKGRGRERSRAEVETALRWSACDWEHHDFAEGVGSLELPPAGDAKRDAKVYANFIKALAVLDEEGVFGKGRARQKITLAVMCGDMSAEFLLRGIKKLNPPAVAKRYLEANTPARLYARLDALPEAPRAAAYLELYVDLALGRDSAAAAEAKQVGITYFGHLESKLGTLGPRVIEGLVEIVGSALGLGAAFNERGSEAWKQHGASTPEMALTTNAALLLGKLGRLSASQVMRLQAALSQRQKLDESIGGIVSTLAENIGRTLHAIHPERFPATVKDPKTNRLLNAAAYA